MNENPCFVGIDVSKASLEVALRPSGRQQSFSNDDEGVARLVQWLRVEAPSLIVPSAGQSLHSRISFSRVLAVSGGKGATHRHNPGKRERCGMIRDRRGHL
jgi:hypothetical protein